MIELSAGILALVSVGIFAAHALDGVRGRIRRRTRGWHQWHSSDAGGRLTFSVQLKPAGSGSVACERAFSGSPSW